MQLRRVVVGVDFTDASLAAARWAASHFAPDAEVVLVHVAPGAGVPSFVRADLPSPPAIAAAIAPALYGALRGLAELVDRNRTRVELVIGNPAEALAGLADEMSADVICVGRGQRRRGGARFGATTLQRLLLRTRVPTLVVPASAPETPTRVIVGLDDHSGHGDAVEQAFRLAAALEASVDLLHVIEPEVEHLVSAMREAVDTTGGVSGPLALRALGEANGNDRDWLRDRARTWVHALMEDAGTGAAPGAAVIRWGDPGSEIIRHARQGAANLIVIGRGGGAAQPCRPGALLPLGSTARQVTWAAPCPVLVLPPEVASAVVPRPPGREPRQRTRADVIALRSAQNGPPSRPLPPAARHERSASEEGAA